MTLINRLREEFGFLKGNFLILIVTFTLSGFASGLYFSFRSPYLVGLGASVVQIGLISSIGSVIAAFIRIPGAYIADRFGRRRVIVVFTYFVAVGFLVHALAPSWWFILLGSIILNVSRIYRPALEAIEADSLPEERRGMGYSLGNMAPGIFSALSPPIAGFIVARYGIIYGMRILYMAATLIIVGIAVIRTFYLVETIEVDPLAELTGLWSHAKDSINAFKVALSEMNRDLWAFSLLEILHSFSDPIYGVYLSLYILGFKGISDIQWGFINSLFLPVSMLLGLPVGKLIDRIRRKWSVLLGYLVLAPVGLLLIYSRGFNMLVLVFLVRAVGQTIVFPAVHSLRADLIPVERRGRIMGLIGVMKNLVMVPSAVFFGWIYQEVSPGLTFMFGSVLAVFSILLVLASFGRARDG